MTESGFYEGRIKIIPGLSQKQEIIMDLIEKLKHNEKPFGLLLSKEQRCFEEVGPENCQVQADYSVKWLDCLQAPWKGCFCPASAYRIKPDYQPEPQVEKCGVKPEFAKLQYRREGETRNHSLCIALSDPDFMYFEYENGRKLSLPRVYSTVCPKGGPALIPKYVVFRKATK